MNYIIDKSINFVEVVIFILAITTKNKKFIYILLFFIVAYLISGFIRIYFMKNYFNNHFIKRPNTKTCMINNLNSKNYIGKLFTIYKILPLNEQNKYFSIGIPSFHMTIISSILTSIYLFFPKYKNFILISGIIYTLLMSLELVNNGCHTLLQILFGIIIGIITSTILYNVVT